MSINFVDLNQYFNRYTVTYSLHNKISLGLFNVLTSNKKYNLVLDEIEKENSDILILQEVNTSWLENIQPLKEKYQYFIEHPQQDNLGIALYSKIPILEKNIEFWTDYDVPVVKILFEKDGKRVLLYAVHTLPPISKEYFSTRNEMLKNIRDIITQNRVNVIVAGDLNTTSFSSNYKKYISKSDVYDAHTMLGNIHEGSWSAKHLPFMRITLEHVLSTKDIFPVMYKKGNDIGSDHFPVFVEFSW